jgi:DnaJ domain
MPVLLIGVAVLVFLYWTGQRTGRINANRQRWTAILALLVAALLLVRGNLGLAVVTGSFGFYAMAQVSPYWRRLFAADADGEAPAGRQHAQGDPGPGRGFAGPPGSTKMTEQQAYQVLGIEPGANAQDITRAHRTLMKKFHPDQGGTTYLAARVNEAKDVLLRRHR